MKFLLVFLAVLVCVSAPARSAEKKRFALYGMLLETLPVDLADGAQWMMDKGDTFPVVMFKEQQTKVMLQLAGTSFVVDAKHVKVIEEKNLKVGELASYRRNVQTYIDTRSDQWKKRAWRKRYTVNKATTMLSVSAVGRRVSGASPTRAITAR